MIEESNNIALRAISLLLLQSASAIVTNSRRFPSCLQGFEYILTLGRFDCASILLGVTLNPRLRAAEPWAQLSATRENYH